MCKIFLTSFLVLLIVVNAFANVISEPEERRIEEECYPINIPESRFLIAVNALDVIEPCLWKKLNRTSVQSEINSTRTKENLEGVIERICQKIPDVYECVENRLTQVPVGYCAYTEQEINQQHSILGLVRKLMDFACLNDGIIITDFLFTNGEECFAENSESLRKCALVTYPSLSYINNRTKVQEYCQDLTTVSTCIVSVLDDKCKSSIPARSIESVMKIVLEDFKCHSNIFNETDSKVADNAADNGEHTTETIAINET